MKKLVLPDPNAANITGRKPLNVSVAVAEVTENEIPSSDQRRLPVKVLTAYPLLRNWPGRALPDECNPRSHTAEALKSRVAKTIEASIIENPEHFALANRGLTILADEASFDKRAHSLNISISNPEFQGLADGATTDAVIAKLQTLANREKFFKDLTEEEIPDYLKAARVPVRIITGIKDGDHLAFITQALNTSRQVKSFSLADLRGAFDWIKDILEDEKSAFKGIVGYEENAPNPVDIRDLLSLLTLFHPLFEQEGEDDERSPAIAYSNPSRLDRLLETEETQAGYLFLKPILMDIVSLSETVYADFERKYNEAFTKTKLGRRNDIRSRINNPLILPFTGKVSAYDIAKSYLFPLYYSFRACVNYKGSTAKWKKEPTALWEESGAKLIKELIRQLEGQKTPNAAGKSALVYAAMYKEAKLLLS